MDWLIPSGQFAEHALVAVVAFAVTGLVIVLHYEGMHRLALHYTGREPRGDHRNRAALLKIMFALLALHIVEIWCYGLAYWAVVQLPDTGFVHGEHHAMGNLFDAIYLSATVYSTLGFGDLAPVGPIRLISGMESLTGMLLITWSASFTYLEMARLWGHERMPKDGV